MNGKNYDGTLGMFVEAPKQVDLNRLAFLRWLGEQGRLEHRVAGPSCGAIQEKLDRPESQPEPAYSGKA